MPVEAYNGREFELTPASFHADGVAFQCPQPARMLVHPSSLEIVLPLSDPMVATAGQISDFTGVSAARLLSYQTEAAPIVRSRVSSHQTAEADVWPYVATGGSEITQPGDQIRFRLCNLFMIAERWTATPGGETVRDTTDVTLGGRQWRLIAVDGLTDLQRVRKQRHAYHTFDLVTTARAGDSLQHLSDEATDICTLLQIATSARVGFFCRSIQRGETLAYEQWWATVADTVYGQDILDTHDPTTCRQFLESTWAAFQAVKAPLNISLLVSLYVKSLAEPFAEMRFIAASVLMEAFKHNYGLSVANHPRDGQGYFSRANGHRYSFRDLLTEGWQHYGLTVVNFSFIQFRNAVFHTGAANTQQLRTETATLQALVRKLLLQVLGYHGDFLDINNSFARVPFVP